MKIVFFGTPVFVIPVLQSLVDNFNVAGVVTTQDTLQGRKKILTPTPVKQWALDTIPLAKMLTPQQFNNETIKQLQSLDPDLFVTAAYGKIIPQSVLDIPRIGSLNLHPSLLPKYRGPSPIQTAILNGDQETGITIMQMDAQLDRGPIVAQKTVSLAGDETFASLHQQLFQLASQLLPATIKQWSNLPAGRQGGTIKATPQDESKVIWCKKITKEDGYFDIDNPPDKELLDRMIRAYYPWPTAWSKVRIKNQEVRIKFLPEKKVQIEGGKPVSIKDFLNGYPEMRGLLEKLV